MTSQQLKSLRRISHSGGNNPKDCNSSLRICYARIRSYAPPEPLVAPVATTQLPHILTSRTDRMVPFSTPGFDLRFVSSYHSEQTKRRIIG